MRRVEDLVRIATPRPAAPLRFPLVGVKGLGGGAPGPRPIRRRNRCKICLTQTPDERTLCSYCRQYVD